MTNLKLKKIIIKYLKLIFYPKTTIMLIIYKARWDSSSTVSSDFQGFLFFYRV